MDVLLHYLADIKRDPCLRISNVNQGNSNTLLGNSANENQASVSEQLCQTLIHL